MDEKTQEKNKNLQDLSQLKIGDELMVHAYKLNGWLYRSWNNPKVVYIDEQLLILSSTNTLVITSEEKSIRNFPSFTNKMSYWFFFKNEWFNLIATVENDGIKFYINVASPFIYEEQEIKYYDFDLDFKISSDDKWKEVDINEFIENAKKYHYSETLIQKILSVETKIENYIKEGYFRKLVTRQLLIKLHVLDRVEGFKNNFNNYTNERNYNPKKYFNKKSSSHYFKNKKGSSKDNE
ncbi:conserved hypothetical protein [Ureaplasma urealyticum serovar 2 str. ATCC 27814]|uniref:DUF402 domain-containing protein n=1 Tax=Ureaplasma urealyticum TaxID=2130 RepID=UPI0001794167|nr:DUF402 domain-containing protein [Ureaplasma urealyticum]EEH02289.1 conserved hypothetical protein [Ureaplasma urealyticum serovar 2 str. ATCC 27814]